MIKKAIEKHTYALARNIEELHQHTERMQDAINDARLTVRNADFRDGKLSAHEMLRYTLNMDIAEKEYKEAQEIKVKINRLLSSLNAELKDVQESADLVLNTTNIDLDVLALKKEFEDKGGKHFVQEIRKMCDRYSGKPCPKKSAQLLWEAYKIPIFGETTYETALKYVLEKCTEKQKRGE